MLHASFVYDPTSFMCIFIQYLAFSGTNLLTRCHSVSSCFLLFFLLQKSCTGNILGIARDKLPVPYNHVMKIVPEDDLRGGQPGGQTPPQRGQALACTWVASGPTLAPPTPHLRLFILRFGKILDNREKFHEKFLSRRHQRSHLGRVL